MSNSNSNSSLPTPENHKETLAQVLNHIRTAQRGNNAIHFDESYLFILADAHCAFIFNLREQLLAQRDSIQLPDTLTGDTMLNYVKEITFLTGQIYGLDSLLMLSSQALETLEDRKKAATQM